MSDLVVERCDPRERETEIKDLFKRHGQTRFDAVFERAYRTRAEQGMNSWIGCIDGRVVMHIAVSPLPFQGGGSLMAGVLGDLMVDASHRDFWGPMRLLRTMVSDLTRDGTVDFLFTTTVDDAESVFKGAGFKPFATLRRYVLPLSAPYLGFARLRSRSARLKASVSSSCPHEFDRELSDRPSSHWRPSACPDYYRTRVPRLEHADGRWVTVGGRRAPHAGQLLLSRNEKLNELGIADVHWSADETGLADIVLAAGRWARKQRATRLSISTLGESRIARQLVAAGFFERAVRSQILLRPLSKAAPPAVEDWFLTSFALSGW